MKKRLTIWKDKPHVFVKEAFSVQLEQWQEKVLHSLVKHDRVAVRSGHGVGKTALMSWIIFWWLLTRYPAKIACTAPTVHQLSDILWSEVAKWHKKLHPALQVCFQIKIDKVVLEGTNNASYAVARTARKEQPEAFQGFHSPNMLFLIDEASGVDDIIFEVGQGAMSTKGAKSLMIGNPTRNSGYFYDAFHKARHYWKAIQVSCLDSSQVSEEFIEHMKNHYQEDSDIYRVRVLGDFPEKEDDVIIPLSVCEAAIKREIVASPKKPIWGVDVARFGSDRTALAKRKGNILLEPVKTWSGKDTMQVVGLILDDYQQTPDCEKPSEIIVDVIGIGAGVVDRLKEIGLPVRGVNVGEQASQNDRFQRLRDELWFKVKQWFEAMNVKIPEDSELISELTSIKYSITSSGKLKVESKDEIKKRGIKSPDVADAFCLTFAGYEIMEETMSEKKYKSNKYRQFNTSWMSW